MISRGKMVGPAWVVQLKPGPSPVWISAEGGELGTMYEQLAYRFKSEEAAHAALQVAQGHASYPEPQVYRVVDGEPEPATAPESDAEIQPAHDTATCACGDLLIPALYDRYTMPASVPDGDRRHLRNVVCRGSGYEFKASEVRALQAWWSAGAHEQKLWMQQNAAAPTAPTLQQLRDDDAKLHPWQPIAQVVTDVDRQYYVESDGNAVPATLDAHGRVFDDTSRGPAAWWHGRSVEWIVSHEPHTQARVRWMPAVPGITATQPLAARWREAGDVPAKPGKYWLFDGAQVTLAERDANGWYIDTATARGYMHSDVMAKEATGRGWRFRVADVPEVPQ